MLAYPRIMGAGTLSEGSLGEGRLEDKKPTTRVRIIKPGQRGYRRG